MVPDCAALIAGALTGRQSRKRPDGRPWSEVEATLADLPDQCMPALVVHGRRLLSELPDSDEGELVVVLTGLGRRTHRVDAVKPLLQDAIRSPHTVLKEDYANILNDLFDFADAIEPLNEILDEANRPDLSRAIEALFTLGAEASAPLARRYIHDPDPRLRGTAIGFLREYDSAAAAPLFLHQLRNEVYPEFVRTLVDGLVMWRHLDALPELTRIAETTKDGRLHEFLVRAIHDLETKN